MSDTTEKQTETGTAGFFPTPWASGKLQQSFKKIFFPYNRDRKEAYKLGTRRESPGFET